jgi:hypothetical protein
MADINALTGEGLQHLQQCAEKTLDMEVITGAIQHTRDLAATEEKR